MPSSTIPLTFCSSRGVGLSDFAKEKPWRPPSLILEADPPAHTRTRAVLSQVLSPTVMKQLRDRFAAAAAAKVDELLARGSFDAIADLAEAYPLSVFPDAMGLKQEGREHLLPYAGLVFNAFGPPNQLRQDAIERSAPHQAYVAEQCQRDNLAPGGFGACIHAHVDAGDITDAEAPLLVRSLLSAGLDTTVNGIGAAVYCLARFPDQLARLRGDPSLARNAFEEAVRFESPVQTFFRTTTREVEIGGHRIGEGEKVLMFLGAANRDPRRWDNPDSYDVTRRTSGHVGYGSGIHMCVGQLVARLEGETMLAALARKVATHRDHRPGEAPLQQHAARAREPSRDDHAGLTDRICRCCAGRSRQKNPRGEKHEEFWKSSGARVVLRCSGGCGAARKFPTTSSASACSTTSPASSRTPTAWARWKPRAWRRRISTAAARTSRSRSSMPITRTRPTSGIGDRAQMARCRGRRRHRRRAELGRRPLHQLAAARYAG